MMKSNSNLYTALFSIALSSCAPRINPNVPSDHFKINGYSVYGDDKPGEYYVIHIADRTHYYFWKKLLDGNELLIYDWEGDLESDRVLVMSRDNIIFGVDAKHLEKEIVLKLDEMLLQSEKQVIGKKQ
ncbi:hypothetical protein HYV87_04600 [Candidatus Woesearchaeota archaeon]|nr:hypothetical protein [Candidatus Woesearchaeota archaeon]